MLMVCMLISLPIFHGFQVISITQLFFFYFLNTPQHVKIYIKLNTGSLLYKLIFMLKTRSYKE